MTAQEELDLVDAQIQKILASGVEEFSEATERAVMIRYEVLTKRKDQLQTQINTASGGIFKPVVQARDGVNGGRSAHVNSSFN